MLSDLKFIVGAVARKDYVEELCHILIKDGTATAYDGLLSMSTPIKMDLHVKPHARGLMRAVQACTVEPIAMHVTPGGKLSIKSGKFKAFVSCLDNENDMMHPQPKGSFIEPTAELLHSIKTLAPFMAIDASRPWAVGLRLCGNSTFATNNIILAECWHGSKFPREVIIPADAIQEIIRINEPPVLLQLDDNSITFHYPNDRWLRTQLIAGEWPANLAQIFDMGAPPIAVPHGFFEALETLRPFSEDLGRVYFNPDNISTTNVDGEGASVELDTGLDKGIYHLKQLLLLQGVAHSIGFDAYPKPCPWRGDKLRGVILGLNS